MTANDTVFATVDSALVSRWRVDIGRATLMMTGDKGVRWCLDGYSRTEVHIDRGRRIGTEGRRERETDL